MFLVLFACSGSSVKLDDTAKGPNESTNESGTGHSQPKESVDQTACFSDTYWTQGDHESPMMHPGMACIECHTERREGPQFTIAGTVFTLMHEPDDCNGLARVTVEITDNNGEVFTTQSNSAGNFYLQDRMSFPYAAKIIDSNGNTSEMATHQNNGDCNTCHSQDGSGGAPGRIRFE